MDLFLYAVFYLVKRPEYPNRITFFQSDPIRTKVCLRMELPVKNKQINMGGKGGSLFHPCVTAVERRPCWQSRMEATYCTFGFGISAHHRFPTNHLAITIMGAWCSLHRKGNSCLLGGLSCKNIWRYNNSAPYVTPRWLLQQIPP